MAGTSTPGVLAFAAGLATVIAGSALQANPPPFLNYTVAHGVPRPPPPSSLTVFPPEYTAAHGVATLRALVVDRLQAKSERLQDGTLCCCCSDSSSRPVLRLSHTGADINLDALGQLTRSENVALQRR